MIPERLGLQNGKVLQLELQNLAFHPAPECDARFDWLRLLLVQDETNHLRDLVSLQRERRHHVAHDLLDSRVDQIRMRLTAKETIESP